ncbi:hypothetical protein L195_g038473, partial [Trifolium pratense]
MGVSVRFNVYWGCVWMNGYLVIMWSWWGQAMGWLENCWQWNQYELGDICGDICGIEKSAVMGPRCLNHSIPKTTSAPSIGKFGSCLGGVWAMLGEVLVCAEKVGRWMASSQRISGFKPDIKQFRMASG